MLIYWRVCSGHPSTMLLKKENRFVDVHTSGIPLCHSQLTSSRSHFFEYATDGLYCSVSQAEEKHLCNGYLLAIKHGTGWKISYHVLSGLMIFPRVHIFFPFKCPFLGHVAMFEDTGGSVHKNHTLMPWWSNSGGISVHIMPCHIVGPFLVIMR